MNKQQYDRLAEIVFRTDADGKPTYPGYKPEVRELPNGDGKVDADKRYAHVAAKYLDAYAKAPDAIDGWFTLRDALHDAHILSWRVADALRVSDEFFPMRKYGALRVLEYPVGATSNLHTDFDLFTLMVYRDQPECFVAHGPWDSEDNGHLIPTLCQANRQHEARKLNAQLHIGELDELIGLGPATPHEVIASDRPQHAIVYFALPDHAAVLPPSAGDWSGRTVGEWLSERMSRSRTTK